MLSTAFMEVSFSARCLVDCVHSLGIVPHHPGKLVPLLALLRRDVQSAVQIGDTPFDQPFIVSPGCLAEAARLPCGLAFSMVPDGVPEGMLDWSGAVWDAVCAKAGAANNRVVTSSGAALWANVFVIADFSLADRG